MRLRTPSHKLLFSIAAIAIVAIVVIDRFLKLVAYQKLVTNNVGRGLFVPTTNEGIAFGITIMPLIVIVVSTIIIVGLLIVLARLIFKQQWLQATSVLAILLGAGSNLWDRAQYGFVIDYLSLPLTHINLADALITIGGVCLAYRLVIGSSSKSKDDWNKYYQVKYQIKKDAAPQGLLSKALSDALPSGKALDLGASFQDVRYLLSLGYEVTMVDRDPAVVVVADQITDPKFNFKQESFEVFKFEPDTYTLISAQFSLPFIQKKADLLAVVKNIKSSLKVGGVFAGQFFGPKDTWCINDRPMTFLTKQEVEALFTDMEVILIGEREYDGITELGQKKRWHVIPVIVKKK